MNEKIQRKLDHIKTLDGTKKKRAKGTKALYDYEDELWEQKVREEIERKKKNSQSSNKGRGSKGRGRGRGRGKGRGKGKGTGTTEQKKDPLEVILNEKIEIINKETVIRNNIEQSRLLMNCNLMLVKKILKIGFTRAIDEIPYFQQQLFKLLNIQLFHGPTMDILKEIAPILDNKLKKFAPGIINCIELIYGEKYISEFSTVNNLNLNTFIQMIIQKISKICKIKNDDDDDDDYDYDDEEEKEKEKKKEKEIDLEIELENLHNDSGTINDASFCFIFPIFSQGLKIKKYTKGLHDLILSIIDLHYNCDFYSFQPLVLGELINIINNYPPLAQRAGETLIKVGDNCTTARSIQPIIKSLYSINETVRYYCLGTIKNNLVDDPSGNLLSRLLVLCKDDKSKRNSGKALGIIKSNKFESLQSPKSKLRIRNLIISELHHDSLDIRNIIASGLCNFIKENPDLIIRAFEDLYTKFLVSVKRENAEYERRVQEESNPKRKTIKELKRSLNEENKMKKNKEQFQKLNAKGATRELKYEDQWRFRHGVALCWNHCSKLEIFGSKPEFMNSFYKFLIQKKALGDYSNEVHETLVLTGCNIIKNQSQNALKFLRPIFELFLKTKPEDNQVDDLIRRGVIIFLGKVGKHIKDLNELKKIVAKILSCLGIASESIQRAVGQSAGELIKSFRKDEEYLNKIFDSLLNKIFKSTKYSNQKGASYGLSGMIQGLRARTLGKYDIITKIVNAMKSEKNHTRRGAVILIETLSLFLGSQLEVYLPQILPNLLKGFGDTDKSVREQSTLASKIIIGNLTKPGIKKMLPLITESLQVKSWRTKAAAIEILGNFAYCAPNELSQVLPTIVPILVDMSKSAKTQIRELCSDGLSKIISVIENPEIKSISKELLLALNEPSEHTANALRLLIKTTFGNIIKAPELSLIMPIVIRGLKERLTRIKIMSAQFLGEMCSLTDPKDVVYYVDLVIPKLKNLLLDSQPRVRSLSANAIGKLLQGIGEEKFPDLIEWLLKIINSDKGSVERHGAAQGFAQVYSVLGIERLEERLPEILERTKNKKAYIREGNLAIFIFLPYAFKENLKKLIQPVLNCIINSLADSIEDVRVAALKAGRAIIKQYCDKYPKILIQEIVRAMFSNNWNIRSNSLELINQLFRKISGYDSIEITNIGVPSQNTLMVDETKKKLSIEEKELIKKKKKQEQAKKSKQMEFINDPEIIQKRIQKHLGDALYRKIYSALFILRSDENRAVSKNSLSTWKNYVYRTPSTLVYLLPNILSYVIKMIQSKNKWEKTISSSTLGELTRLKIPIMETLLPLFGKFLKSENVGERQGVCVGLRGILMSSKKAALIKHIDEIVDCILMTLCDPEKIVRKEAANSFDEFYKLFRSKSVSLILPPLLLMLQNEKNRERGLNGLTRLLGKRAKLILPDLIPQLLYPKITLFKAKALESIVSVANDTLTQYIKPILIALCENYTNQEIVYSNYSNILKKKYYNLNDEDEDEEEEDQDGSEYSEDSSEIEVEYGQDDDDDDDEDNIDEEKLKMKISKKMRDKDDEKDLETTRQQSMQTAKLICSTMGSVSIRTLLDSFRTLIDYHENDVQIFGFECLTEFLKNSTYDMEQIANKLFQILINQFNNQSQLVCKGAITAFNELIKRIPSQELVYFFKKIVQYLRDLSENVDITIKNRSRKPINAFLIDNSFVQISKSINWGIVHGSSEIKEYSANLISTYLDTTTPKACSRILPKFLGPLIRVASDRFSWEVKVSILECFCLIIQKGGLRVRPFLGPIQTLLIRGLASNSQSVRKLSAFTLSELIKIQPKPENVFTELYKALYAESGYMSGESIESLETTFYALYQMINEIGHKISDKCLIQFEEFLFTAFSNEFISIRQEAGKAFGTMIKFIKDDQQKVALLTRLLEKLNEEFNGSFISVSWDTPHGLTNALFFSVHYDRDCLKIENFPQDEFLNACFQLIKEDKTVLIKAGLILLAEYISVLDNEKELQSKLFSKFKIFCNSNLKNELVGIRVATLYALKRLVRNNRKLFVDWKKELVPKLITMIKGRSSKVKKAANKVLIGIMDLHNINNKDVTKFLSKLNQNLRKNTQEFFIRQIEREEESDFDELEI